MKRCECCSAPLSAKYNHCVECGYMPEEGDVPSHLVFIITFGVLVLLIILILVVMGKLPA